MDGVDDYLDIGNTLKPNFPITVVAFVKGVGPVLANDQVNSRAYRHGFMLWWDPAAPQVSFYSGFSSPGKRTAQVPDNFGGVDPSKWHFVCVVMHSALDTEWYIDCEFHEGVRVGDGTGTSMTYSAPNGSGPSGTVGTYLPDGGYHFNGAIDEIRVYRSALSMAEIKELHGLDPTFLQTPKSVHLARGTSHVFRAEATSRTPVSYQWYRRNAGTSVALEKATNQTFTINNATPNFAGQYLVEASGECGAVLSPPFRVHVSEIVPNVAEMIAISFPTSQGKDYDILTTHRMKNRQMTNNDTLLNCGRFVGWTTITNLAGTGAIVQTLIPTQTPYDFFKVEELVAERTNKTSCVEPPADSLTIEYQPEHQSIPLGGTAVFSVGVRSPGPVYYQWHSALKSHLQDDVFLTGTTTCTLTVRNPSESMAGDYWVDVINNGVTHTSGRARLDLMTFLARADRTARVTFAAIPGAHYQLQSIDNLDMDAWTNWGNPIKAIGSEVTVDYTNAMPERLWFRAI